MNNQIHTDSFAYKLNFLFDLKVKANGDKYIHKEVYQATGITMGTISKLRTGRITNPSFESIQALAVFFEVSPSYFFLDITENLPPELIGKPDPVLEMIILRANTLSQRGRQALLEMLDHIIRLEHVIKLDEDVR